MYGKSQRIAHAARTLIGSHKLQFDWNHWYAALMK